MMDKTPAARTPTSETVSRLEPVWKRVLQWAEENATHSNDGTACSNGTCRDGEFLANRVWTFLRDLEVLEPRPDEGEAVVLWSIGKEATKALLSAYDGAFLLTDPVFKDAFQRLRTKARTKGWIR